VQGETGLLVPPASPELLAAAIVDLLLNKKKAVRLASAGLAEVQKRFSLERMVAQIEHIYYSLCQ
jgi:glycosyltransferase involved in cell wall biosynthesis